MTGLRILGAAAMLASALIASARDGAAGDPEARLMRAVLSQRQLPEPGTGKSLYRQLSAPGVSAGRNWQNSYNRYGYRPSGFWPADVAAGVVAGAVGTAAAIATAPFRDAYAYYGNSSDDTYAYYGDRPMSRRSACGLQSGATYMGRTAAGIRAEHARGESKGGRKRPPFSCLVDKRARGSGPLRSSLVFDRPKIERHPAQPFRRSADPFNFAGLAQR